MKFPNAYKGVKKLFVAEIIGIIACFVMAVAAVLMTVGLNNEPVLIASSTVALVGSIALLVVFIISLVGLYQGGDDEPQIKVAFYLTLVTVGLSLLATVFSAITKVSGLVTASKYIAITADVAAVIALEYTLLGIAELSKKCGDEKMARLGKTLTWCVLLLYILSVVMNLYGTILANNVQQWVKITVSVAAIVASIAELVVYVLIVVYYGRATKMLKK